MILLRGYEKTANFLRCFHFIFRSSDTELESFGHSKPRHAADPIRFLHLPPSRGGSNSVKNSLDPDRDPDQHQKRTVCC